jgi:two-component system phosphate regulon sensor histidine kinase PhoR
LGVDAPRWQALLEATDDAILLVNSSRNILLANPAASRMFRTRLRRSPEPDGDAPASTESESLLSTTLSGELDEVLRESIRRAAVVDTEVSLTQPSARTLHARVAPVSETEFLVVLRDLTELRRLERVRRDFVANVSHELRTPLTSIKAMAETLLDGARTDENVAERFLQTIIGESDRLVRLSADLLDLSRAETRGVQKTEVDLAGLIGDVITRLSVQAQAAGVTLNNHVRSPLIASIDRDEMAQVVVNLLDNAVSYTPRGGEVDIVADEDEDTVTVAVIDTGIGIMSHDIPRLFERFYRADKARSRASGGTGLGLSIVKHIVENHGGSVGVQSEYNNGSTFTFTLPKS